MSSLGSPSTLFLAKKGVYEVQRSLRFNLEDNTYLGRTSASASSTFTLSLWLKRGISNTNDNRFQFIFAAGNYGLYFYRYGGGLTINNAGGDLQSTERFRDPSAWYHIVLSMNSGTATTYVNNTVVHNGVTGFSLTTGSDETRLGRRGNGNYPFDGYMAEVNLIDGQALTPSSFAETNADTGQWNPKKYGGGYGTNGFYLNFSDNSGTSSTTLGKDSSGNGNNFTPNNFVTGDAVKDSPTNNFSTLRFYGTPAASGASLSEGNLRFVSGTSGSARNLNRSALSTIMPTSGKWYAEVKIISYSSSSAQTFIGVAPYQVLITPTSTNSRWVGIYGDDGDKYVNTNGSETNSSYGGTSTQNDIMGIYIDMDASTPEVYFAKNGQWGNGSGSWNQSTPTSAITLGNSFFTESTGGFEGIGLYLFSGSGSFNVTLHANFGQDSTFSGGNTAGGNTDASGIGDFKYAVPTGAKAMCSANLPDPTILLPKKHFGTLLWTGNATVRTISDTSQVNFTPDWVWVKCRTAGHDHQLTDSVRGSSKALASNIAEAEIDWDVLYSGNNKGMGDYVNGGFILDDDGNNARYNQNSQTFVAWNWNAGDTDGKTYTVTVVSDSGNKYRFDGYGTSAVTLDLAEGGTYIFNYPSAHPFRFSTTSDGTHGGGSEYTTGVTVLSSTSIQIVVAASAPQLYYFCTIHSGMGGAINTNSTLGSSNFDGSIQSTVKVNATAGFSIATWVSDGSGSPTSFGHGLGIKPEFIIIKNRTGSSGNWAIWSSTFTNATNNFLILNIDNGTQTAGAAMWGTIDSSVVNFRHSANSSNGNTMVGYFFNSVKGFSQFGSYTGNGNTDGTFVFTGFRPAWVMIKTTQQAGDWIIIDSKRDPHNVTKGNLQANQNATENTSYEYHDFLANGFKLRTSSASRNPSGQTVVYLAFAESPFKNARAR